MSLTVSPSTVPSAPPPGRRSFPALGAIPAATRPGATAAELLAFGRARGVAEIMLPRIVRPIEALPMLATGKADYSALSALAVQTSTVPRPASLVEVAA